MAGAKTTVTKSLRAEAWVWDALEARAVEEGQTLSGLVRLLLIRAVESPTPLAEEPEPVRERVVVMVPATHDPLRRAASFRAG